MRYGTFVGVMMNVKGIGEKSFLKMKPLITVAAEKGDRAGSQK